MRNEHTDIRVNYDNEEYEAILKRLKYRQFQKTLPRSSEFISVRFYETECTISFDHFRL